MPFKARRIISSELFISAGILLSIFAASCGL